jgi:hypothetical protein
LEDVTFPSEEQGRHLGVHLDGARLHGRVDGRHSALQRSPGLPLGEPAQTARGHVGTFGRLAFGVAVPLEEYPIQPVRGIHDWLAASGEKASVG